MRPRPMLPTHVPALLGTFKRGRVAASQGKLDGQNAGSVALQLQSLAYHYLRRVPQFNTGNVFYILFFYICVFLFYM